MRKILILIVIMLQSFSAIAQFNSITPAEKYLKIGSTNKYTKEPNYTSLQNFEENKSLLSSKNFENTRKRLLLSLPIDTIIVTSNFGNRIHPINQTYKFHKGIDLAARNNYIYSIMSGRVKKVGRDNKLGIFVVIEHGDFTTTYGHLNEYLVEKGQKVEAGTQIGISGSTGNSTGEHLHFQVTYKDKIIDPAPILQYILKIKEISKQELNSKKDVFDLFL